MATVTGFTAERMKQIEDETVVDGDVVGDNLVLTRRNGQTISAGNVRGPQGIQGIPGSITASPASGALAGNYPNPSLAPSAVKSGNVDEELKDGDPTQETMRSLGTGAQQAAAGDHDHDDGGWVAITPSAVGGAPFGTRLPTYLEYRIFGPLVEIRFSKTTASAVDLSASVAGNFPNVSVFPVGTIVDSLHPSRNIEGDARMVDAPQSIVLTHDGAIVWTGGFARNYPTGSVMTGRFMYFRG